MQRLTIAGQPGTAPLECQGAQVLPANPGIPEGPPGARACRPEASRGASKELIMTLLCRWSWARSDLGAGIHSNHGSWVTSAGSCGGHLGPPDTLHPAEGALATSFSVQERKEHEPGTSLPPAAGRAADKAGGPGGIAWHLWACSLRQAPGEARGPRCLPPPPTVQNPHPLSLSPRGKADTPASSSSVGS